MSRPILTCGLGLLAMLAAPALQARGAQLQVARIKMPAGSVERLRINLDWPANVEAGTLELQAAQVDLPALGGRLRAVRWHCPLQRLPASGWACAGALRAAGIAPMRLAIRLDETALRAELAHAGTRVQLARAAARPDEFAVVLQQVPLAWMQGLLAQAWPQARFTGGQLDGRLRVQADAHALQVVGPLQLRALGLQNGDGSIAGEGLGAHLQLRYRAEAEATRIATAGELRGGEFLVGNTYVALPAAPVGVQLEAVQQGRDGWRLPRIAWNDGAVLTATAQAALDAEGHLDSLSVQARSDDLTPLKPRYLSGWMGLAGLGGVDLHGGLTLAAQMQGGQLQALDARLRQVDVRDPDGRFVFDHLQGDLRYSAGTPVASALQWQGGQLYGLKFGAARLPLTSAGGVLVLPQAGIPLLGGRLTLRDAVIRPPRDGDGLEIYFGLHLADVDFGQVAQALELPPFQGRLGGDIPRAHYARDRIDFEGGLQLGLFDGQVRFSSLALERPFGTAPSLSADIALRGLDLLRLTEVLGFGSISGRLDGRIDGLRLVDWTPVAFDAWLATADTPGVRRRISQRAVQDIGRVGGTALVQTLQGRLIALFQDFGYRRIGIGCRLENQVCAMSGLRSEGNAFTIVEGQGLPRLDVVGHNRAVDWPTLVERLLAASKGDVAPVVD
ncbi:MAG: hypothetical protein ACOY4A_07060 [Pseudomonadota bacterium]